MPHRSAAQMYRAARKSDALLTGAPLPTLFYFALPIILGNIFQQLYSIVDAIVVGKFLGDLPLAGISVAAPIVDVANALVIGGTIRIGVLCAQMCGAEDWTRLRCMNATALLGGAALTLVIAAVGIVCSVPLLRAQCTEDMELDAMALPQPNVSNFTSSMTLSLIFRYIFIISPHLALPTSPTPSASGISPTLRGFLK